MVAKCFQQVAIGLRGSLNDRIGTSGHNLHSMTCGKSQTLRSRGAIPERRIRPLFCRDFDRRSGKFVALATMRNLTLAQTLNDHLERLLEDLARFEEVHIKIRSE